MTDAKAFIAWLDQQPSVAKNRKIGTQGYCMGGPMAFRTAAAVPDRVGAVASFHGGGLVTPNPNSPHLQASKTKAQFLIAIAANDDMRVARREERSEGHVREGEPAGGDRGLHRRRARLVPARFGRLQRAAGREGLDPSAGAVRESPGVASFVSMSEPVSRPFPSFCPLCPARAGGASTRTDHGPGTDQNRGPMIWDYFRFR